MAKSLHNPHVEVFNDPNHTKTVEVLIIDNRSSDVAIDYAKSTDQRLKDVGVTLLPLRGYVVDPDDLISPSVDKRPLFCPFCACPDCQC